MKPRWRRVSLLLWDGFPESERVALYSRRFPTEAMRDCART